MGQTVPRNQDLFGHRGETGRRASNRWSGALRVPGRHREGAPLRVDLRTPASEVRGYGTITGAIDRTHRGTTVRSDRAGQNARVSCQGSACGTVSPEGQGCESHQHVASYRPRSLGTETVWHLWRSTGMGSEGTTSSAGTTSSSGGGDSSPANVVLTTTPMQAKALATLIGRSARRGSGLDALRIALIRGASEVDSREPSSAASVLSETKAFVAGAQVEIAAAREAKYVAKSAAATKKSVLAAALMTAEAASHARDVKASAAARAALNLADTAAQTASRPSLLKGWV